MTEFEIDLSLLQGLRFTCLEGCGYCCLFQPDVAEDEKKRLEEIGLSWAVTKSHFSGFPALKLQGNGGACTFLKGKRCQIYEDRPHFCREFPFHIYLGERVQVIPNLSCRGLWLNENGGAVKGLMPVRSAEEAAMPFVRRITPDMLKEPLRTFAEFNERMGLKQSGQTRERISSVALALKGLLTDYNGLASILEFSWEYSGEMLPPEEIKEKIAGWEPETDLRAEAIEGAVDSLGLENPADLPVYSAEDLSWYIFQVSGGRVVRKRMTEKGPGRDIDSVSLDGVPLRELDAEAKSLLLEYIDTLVKRDAFYGYVAYLASEEGGSMLNAYLGTLATSVLDLLWRTSMLMRFEHRDGRIDRRALVNGIVFYDGDLLDAPALGEFV